MKQPHEPRPRPRIGFVHRYDARNMRSWSGAFYFMAKALEDHVGEVVYLGPDNSRGTRFLVNANSYLNRIWYRITGKNLMTDHNRWFSERLGRFFAERLTQLPCDVLFAPVASVEIANLETHLPIIYMTDVPWAAIVGYYPEFSSLSSFGLREGERTEAMAIKRARASVFPSLWAANCALNHYGAAETSVFKVSLGANLLEPPSREMALSRRMGAKVKLLVVGVDWVRKGGPIAFDCLKALHARGVDARLTIVGCVPPETFKDSRMTVIPFLDKNEPVQRKKLSDLFMEADFFLFPTRAEGLGMVTCEASAFGLPTLGTNTGGVAGALNDGVNGFLMPIDAPGREYAEKIIWLVNRPAAYEALVISSRDEFERALNWDAWGLAMRPVVDGVLGTSTASVVEKRAPEEMAVAAQVG